MQRSPEPGAARRIRRSYGRRLGTTAFWRSHPTLVAMLVYALLSVVMVGQGVLPGRTLSGSDGLLSEVPWQATKPASVPGLGTNFELADSADVFQPFIQYTRSTLPKVPLWNPYLGTGRPFVADGQSAVFSPFSIPSYLIPFWKSLAIAAMLKLFLGALGAYALARVLGMRFGGALLSGTIFAFGTFFVVWLAWPLTSVYAFAPWILALTELLVRRPTARNAAGLAALVGLQFLGGHPESSFHLMFVTVCFFVFRALWHARRRAADLRSLAAPVLTFVAALILGAGLAALALAPFVEFVLHSGDLSRRTGAAAGYWPRKYLGALFLHDYWGRPTQVDLTPFMQIRGWYAGAATLMLAAAGLLIRRSLERIAIVLFALFCVCMVVGISPIFSVVSALPGFNAAHNERLLIYVLLSLALLAGWGLDDLCSPALLRGALRRVVLVCSAAIFCVPFLWLIAAGTLNLHELGNGLKVAWGFAHPPVPGAGVDPNSTPAAAIVRDSAILIWLVVAGAALVLITLRLRAQRPLHPGVFVALMTVVLMVDLFRANMGFNTAIPISTAAPPVTGSIRYLQSQRPNRFVGVSTLALGEPLPVDLAMQFGLYDARAYDFPVEKRLDALWRRSVAPTVGDFTQPEEFAGSTPAALRALGLLSVSDLLIGPLQSIKYPVKGPGVSVAYHGSDGVVYRNARALPRTFVVDQQRTIPGEDAQLAAVTAPGFDGRTVAVTGAPLPGLAQGNSAAPTAGNSAHLRSYGAEQVTIDATSRQRGLLVLTDDYYPGWTATVDGRAAAVRRVDYLLRGVALPPGRHTVVFRYRPSAWRIGWILSLASLLIVAALAIAPKQFRRRAPEPAPG